MSRQNINTIWIGCTVISELTLDVLKCFNKNFRYCLGDRMLDYILGALNAASRMIDAFNTDKPHDSHIIDCIHNLRMFQTIMQMCLSRNVLTVKQLTNLTKEIVPVWELLNKHVKSESV